MQSLLLVLVLGCGEPKGTLPCPANVVAAVQADLRTGDLIFSRGDCLAVRIFSNSPYTHVGAVVVEGDRVEVFDSMNGVGVRRTALADYLTLQTPSDVHIVRLKSPLSAEQAAAFRGHLIRQLGRPYAIRHHVTGDRAEGLHCAEYMTDALMSARLLHASRPSRVSPGSLLQGLEEGGLCCRGMTLSLREARPAPSPETTWCQRTWTGTVDCCRDCAVQMRRWVLCR